MAKQEEIREVIDLYTDDECLYPSRVCPSFKGNYCDSDDNAYKCLMKRLDELGVVLKVFHEGEIKLKHTKRSVGWITYESLIKED